MVIWQLIDSGFPSGGFAHSGGLEASVHHGLVADAAGVAAFARQALAQAGRRALPLMTAAYDDPAELARARSSCRFVSQQSRGQSSQPRTRPSAPDERRSDLFRQPPPRRLECARRETRTCAATTLLCSARLSVRSASNGPTAARALFFTTVRTVDILRGAARASRRIRGTGGPGAARGTSIELTLERCSDLTPADIAQTAPLIDLCQSTHDRLYSRLFQS